MTRAARIAAAAALMLAAGCAPPADDAEPPAEDAGGVEPDIAAAFPDYEPKTTPDDLLDYRPALASRMRELPDATRETAPALFAALERWRARAADEPGETVPGNVALGADPEEYVPSDAELMWGLAGARLAAFAEAEPDAFRAALPENAESPLTYPVFQVRHVDVMGSGRFFYVSEPEMREISADD